MFTRTIDFEEDFEEDKTVEEKKYIDKAAEDQEKEAETGEALTIITKAQEMNKTGENLGKESEKGKSNVTDAKDKKKVAEKSWTKYDIHLMATKPGAGKRYRESSPTSSTSETWETEKGKSVVNHAKEEKKLLRNL